MFLRTLGVVTLAGLLAAAAARGDDDAALAAQMKKFEGTWDSKEVNAEGLEVTSRLVIKGNSYESRDDKGIRDRGKWKFVAQKGNILHIDLNSEVATALKGIFEWVDKDNARICGSTEDGDVRPVKFTAEKGSKQSITTFKRVP